MVLMKIKISRACSDEKISRAASTHIVCCAELGIIDARTYFNPFFARYFVSSFCKIASEVFDLAAGTTDSIFRVARWRHLDANVQRRLQKSDECFA